MDKRKVFEVIRVLYQEGARKAHNQLVSEGLTDDEAHNLVARAEAELAQVERRSA